MEAGRTLARALAVAAAAIAAAVIAVLVSSRSTSSFSAADGVQHLPASPASALRVPAPIVLSTSGAAAYWASVRRAVSARASPSNQAPLVAPLATTTPEGTANIVLVLGRARDRAGRLWV